MEGKMAKEPQPEKTYEEKMLDLAKSQLKNIVSIKETIWVVIVIYIIASIIRFIFA
jgi:hypothetical protein